MPPPRLNLMNVLLPTAAMLMRWLSQRPCSIGWLSMIAIVPLLLWHDRFIDRQQDHSGHDRLTATQATGWLRRLKGRFKPYWSVWLCGFLFWAASLQGLRHAHPLMFIPWLALAAYFGFYPVLFLAGQSALRHFSVPPIVAVPVSWVAFEWIRNHVLSGISACMLGHSLVDYAVMIQIGDLFGSYGVSYVVVMVNAAIWIVVARPVSTKQVFASQVATAVVLAAVIAYGRTRLNEPVAPGRTTFLLMGLDEQTEYNVDSAREERIFSAYLEATRIELQRAAAKNQTIHAVVWPESMYGGNLAWMLEGKDLQVPDGVSLSKSEFVQSIDEYREAFLRRALDIDSIMSAQPSYFVGGPVVRYDREIQPYSAMFHVRGGKVDWYGKTHLVLFGETIPVLSDFAFLRRFVPPGLGLARGAGPKLFQVTGTDTKVLANICIETAVERVAVNHTAELQRTEGQSPDAIITITNDSWFDHSSVVEHHLVCDQFVAIATRTPVLSAGNGGPTAWINSNGQVVDRVASGAPGVLTAVPDVDSRRTLYCRFGSWPAGILAVVTLLSLARPVRQEKIV